MITNNSNNNDIEMKTITSLDNNDDSNSNNTLDNDEIFFSILCGDMNLFDSIIEKSNNNNTNNTNTNNNTNNNIEIYLPYIILEMFNKNQELLLNDDINKLFISPTYSKLVYNINQYQSLNYNEINKFIQQQIKIRKSLNNTSLEKKETFLDNIDNPKYQFENGDKLIKLKLVLSDVIALLEFSEMQQSSLISKDTKYDALFIDTPIYNNELNIIFPIICFKCLKYIEFNKLIQSILFLNQSYGYLIKLILSNNPNEFNEIIEIIIGIYYNHNILVVIGIEKIKKALIEICKLSKYSSRFIRSELMSRQILPDLVLLITSQFIKDEIDLLSNIISNRFQSNQWLKDYISTSSSSSSISSTTNTFNEIRESLLSTLELINSSQQPITIEQSFIVKSIIRLYCGFSGLLGIKMNQQEILISLSFIEKPIFKNYSKIFLCFLLVCEGLVKSIQSKRVVGYLGHLSKVGNCDELLLLISIYFHTHQLQNIALLVRGILGFRPSIHTESLNQIGELLTKEIYIESLVTKKAASLPIIKNLNNNTSTLSTNNQSISIVCIYHLLSERIFEKYETDVGHSWCWSQLKSSTTPIHYLLPSLLDKLVMNIIEPSINIVSSSTSVAASLITPSTTNVSNLTSPTSNVSTTTPVSTTTTTPTPVPTTTTTTTIQQPFYMKRIQESIIMNTIQENKSNVTVQILVIYFVLRFNDSVMKFKSEQKGRTIQYLIETTQLREYSIEFLSKLPIQNCINIILANQSDYFFIIPPFLYLILSQFPQFFNINLLLLEEERLLNPIENFNYLPNFYSTGNIGSGTGSGMTIEFLKESLKRTLNQTTSVQLILRFLNTLSVQELLPYTDTLLDQLLPIIIKHRSLPSVASLISPFTEIWGRVFPISQSSIALKTINILTCLSVDDDEEEEQENNQDVEYTSSNSNGLLLSMYTYTDIISDPLMIFRCHPTVFTCPPLFKILLQILFFFMVSSKKNLQNQIHHATSISNSKQQQEDIATLILTQESTIIQILLEICIIDRIDTKGLNKILKRQSSNSSSNSSTNSSNKSYDSVDIEEIRCQICSFIHQMFIDKPLIIKLVHFQGYQSQLLPITVTLIPSMHICFEFIPELLSQPTLEKQIFSIQLLSYLCEKFPIPKSLKISKQALSRISFNLNSVGIVGGVGSGGGSLSMDDKIKFLHSILPSITRITKTFPSLAEDFVSILIEQLPTKNNFQQNLKSFISTIDFNNNSNLNNQLNSNFINNNNNNSNNNNNNDLLNIDFDGSLSNSSSPFRMNHDNLINEKSLFTKNESWLTIKEYQNNFNVPIEQEIHQTIQIIIKNLSK